MSSDEKIQAYLKTLSKLELENLAETAIRITAEMAVHRRNPSEQQWENHQHLFYTLPHELIVEEKWDRNGQHSIEAVNFWRDLLDLPMLNEMPSLKHPGATEVRVLTGEELERARAAERARMAAEDAHYAEEDAAAFAEDEK